MYIVGQERRLVDPPSQVVAGVRTVTTQMDERCDAHVAALIRFYGPNFLPPFDSQPFIQVDRCGFMTASPANLTKATYLAFLIVLISLSLAGCRRKRADSNSNAS